MSWTASLRLPNDAIPSRNSTAEAGSNSVLHDALGALRIDDAFGKPVHRLDLFFAPVGGLAAEASRQQLGLDVPPHLGGQRIQPMIRLRNIAPERRDYVSQEDDGVRV